MTEKNFISYLEKLTTNVAMRSAADAAVEGKTAEEAHVIAAEMATSAGFACTNVDVLKTMEGISAAQTGGELSEEQLEIVSGGWGWNPFTAAEKKINTAGNTLFYGILPQPD